MRNAWRCRVGRILVAGSVLVAGAMATSSAPAARADEAAPVLRDGAGEVVLLDQLSDLDRIEVRVHGLDLAPTGHHYRVWAIDDGGVARYLADAVPDAGGSHFLGWNQPAGENLLAQVNEVVVTLEAGAAGTAPGGAVVRSGRFDAAAIAQVRRLLSRWPGSRYGTASIQGLRRHGEIAHELALTLREAAEAGDLAGARRKAEHLVNLVEGQSGRFYADHDGDGRIEDPGDGTGYLAYGWGALEQSQFVWATAVDESLAAAALAIQEPVTFGLDSAGSVRDAGIAVATGSDAATIRDLAGQLVVLTDSMMAAADTQGDAGLVAVLDARGLTSAASRARALVRIPLAEAGR